MALDTTVPFRGSGAVRDGEISKDRLRGPAFRRLEYDTHVRSDVADAPSRRRRYAPDEVTVEDGVPVTTPRRTAVDLAAGSGPVRGAVDRVIEPLTDAVVAVDALARLGWFDADGLRECARRRPGARDVSRVATVAALMDPGAESPPETRLRVTLVLAGLPRPVTQFRLRDGLDALGRLLDLSWPRYRVVVEYDGRDRARADRRGRDLDRIDDLRRAGWIVIVVTAAQLARPSWVPDRVREALVSRGWTPGETDEWAWLRAENTLRSR